MIQYRFRKGKNLPKIVSVNALDGDYFDVTLDSGHTILLELGSRTGEPAFDAMIKAGEFDKPQTDGERLFWQGGPSITLPEIFSMLMTRGAGAGTFINE